jgi:hypothetical protein
VINGAFALHHIRPLDGERDTKQRVLESLHALDPAVLVLCEPNSDHATASFGERFRNSWNHFGATFQMLDALDLTEAQRDGIKVLFFRREIDDILGGTDEARSERHETAAMWTQRIHAARFKTRRRDARTLPAVSGVMSLSSHDGYLGLDFGGETIVAITAAHLN